MRSEFQEILGRFINDDTPKNAQSTESYSAYDTAGWNDFLAKIDLQVYRPKKGLQGYPSNQAKTSSSAAPNEFLFNQYPEKLRPALIFFASRGFDFSAGWTKDNLKHAFRRLAKQLHPDKFAQRPVQDQKRAHELFQALQAHTQLLMNSVSL